MINAGLFLVGGMNAFAVMACIAPLLLIKQVYSCAQYEVCIYFSVGFTVDRACV
jgi:hypothetical protein